MKKFLAVIGVTAIVSALVIGCATSVPRIKQTASGRPEALFVGESVDQVKNKIIADLAASKMMLTDSGDNYLLYSRPIDGGAEAAMMVLYNINTSGTYFLRYILAPQGNNTFVTAHMYMEINKPLGKEIIQSTHNDGFNQCQQRLIAIGGQ